MTATRTHVIGSMVAGAVLAGALPACANRQQQRTSPAAAAGQEPTGPAGEQAPPEQRARQPQQPQQQQAQQQAQQQQQQQRQPQQQPQQQPQDVVREETQRVQVTATVESVDREQRTLTLESPEGDRFVVEVSEEENLAQIEPGDRLNVEYFESVALSLQRQPMTGTRTETQETTEELPEGLEYGRRVTASAEIVRIDPEANLVTFRAPGTERRVVVIDPAHQRKLQDLSPGDQVQVTYTENVAVSLEPAEGMQQQPDDAEEPMRQPRQPQQPETEPMPRP